MRMYMPQYMLHNVELLSSIQSRRSRKRAKLSPSSDTTSSPSTSPAKRRRKKNLPIGKVVFMESERRKLSWLPAVVREQFTIATEKH